MPLKVDSQAPDFTLPSTSGSDITLSKDLAGKPCIVYFYPKDFTPGCTKEACEFRDAFEEFRGLEIDIFGISRDSIESHDKFRAEHQLPFHLLSDKSGDVCKAYQSLIPFIGVPKRITYLLDKDHKIAAVNDSMFDAVGHIKNMIAKVKEG
ncbi:MAG: peroxiredoxin Q/BCP [Flammeovirgaceae bacterium]|jgi:peroxiredoxin Q/BCP